MYNFILALMHLYTCLYLYTRPKLEIKLEIKQIENENFAVILP